MATIHVCGLPLDFRARPRKNGTLEPVIPRARKGVLGIKRAFMCKLTNILDSEVTIAIESSDPTVLELKIEGEGVLAPGESMDLTMIPHYEKAGNRKATVTFVTILPDVLETRLDFFVYHPSTRRVEVDQDEEAEE